MKHSDQVDVIAKALVLIEKDMKSIVKDAENPFFKSEYATLTATLDLIRPIASKHGVAIIQGAESLDGHPMVSTMLLHESGQWIMTESTAGEVAKGPQPYGSATSYLRRYSLQAVFSTSSTDEGDDDGNKAQVATDNVPSKPSVSQPSKPKSEGQSKLSAVDQAVVDTVKKFPKALIDLAWQAKCQGFRDVADAYVKCGNDKDALKQYFEEKIRAGF